MSVNTFSLKLLHNTAIVMCSIVLARLICVRHCIVERHFIVERCGVHVILSKRNMLLLPISSN